MRLNGIIIKGIGGFYYVEAAEELFECKARGLFRNTNRKPLPGDNVVIAVSEGRENTIDEMLPRRSLLSRPPIANIDRLFIVVSVDEPKPNTYMVDKMAAIACRQGIEPVFIFTKIDLCDSEFPAGIYEKAGYEVHTISCVTNKGIEKLKTAFQGHISALAGNSGVGKSTLLNYIDTALNLETGNISEKLGRGRHTTRYTQLYKAAGGYIADTPGFGTVGFEEAGGITKEDLPFCFKEFKPFLGSCRFASCAHILDKGCSITQAVESGQIAESRHASYAAMYRELNARKDWDSKNG